ncbi:MAG: ribosome-binding factor A [Bacteroidia bacterium]
MKNQNKEIRHLIAQKLKSDLRIIPELIFYIDDSLDYAEKIENLLKK